MYYTNRYLSIITVLYSNYRQYHCSFWLADPSIEIKITRNFRLSPTTHPLCGLLSFILSGPKGTNNALVVRFLSCTFQHDVSLLRYSCHIWVWGSGVAYVARTTAATGDLHLYIQP